VRISKILNPILLKLCKHVSHFGALAANSVSHVAHGCDELLKCAKNTRYEVSSIVLLILTTTLLTKLVKLVLPFDASQEVFSGLNLREARSVLPQDVLETGDL
jgi:hypothetical protein